MRSASFDLEKCVDERKSVCRKVYGNLEDHWECDMCLVERRQKRKKLGRPRNTRTSRGAAAAVLEVEEEERVEEEVKVRVRGVLENELLKGGDEIGFMR